MALALSSAAVLLVWSTPAAPDPARALHDPWPHTPQAVASSLTDTTDSTAAAATAPRPVLTDTTEADTTEADTTEAPGAAAPLADSMQTDRITTLSDTLGAADSLTAMSDSLVRGDTTQPAPRVERYIEPLYRRARTPDPFETPSPFLYPQASGQQRSMPEISVDSTGQYSVRPLIGQYPLQDPVPMDRSRYRSERLRADLRSNWQSIAEQRRRNQNDRSGLGVNIVVPGGRQSAFSTIFGKPQVDLRVNGQADINAGFDYRKSDQQVSATGDPSQISPNFKQDLRLGITGTIGDKMQINVDWDTNNQFDYQNQVKLKYTGYEDEILQSVEAGNVFLETPSSLIRGGQSLFGLKSEFQLGNLSLTTVASQQEGQSKSLSIEGGSEKTEFTLEPTEYDDNTHFFLSYYFRNRWNDALSQPPDIVLSDGFGRITDIEVWKLRTTANPDETNVRKGVAVVDLGDPQQILTQANGFTSPVLPNDDGSNDAVDQYTTQNLETLRDGDAATQPVTYLTTPGNLQQTLSASDYQIGDFKKLERGRDYTLDELLGYVSLNQRLQSNEALAVSFRYRANGQTFTVGDFASESGGTSGGQNADRLMLKLLRPANLTQPSEGSNPAAWYLQLRNIYRLRGRGFNADNFDLQIQYDPSGQAPTTTIPQISSQSTLLQLLGLDRLNEDQAQRPDDQFDFLRGYTIEPGDGVLIFPYLEPFGQRLSTVIDNQAASPSQAEQLKSQFVFSNLYTQKRENAQRDTELDIYSIEGSYQSTTKDFYDLGAFAGVVEGSVEVTAGGTPLEEGTDYVVDYQGGTVTITNPTYLASGRTIDINYEQNSFANLQKKTLLGARANYSLQDEFSLGATVMRLSEKSPVDKFRIGEEPIKNTIWGVDGSMNLEPRWLTRAVDALPLVQTKENSALSVSGEYAQLRPGHTQTNAFDRTRENLQEEGRDFRQDELNGISYIDDFEGFENTFSLKQQLNAWQISAPPDSIGRHPMDSPGTVDDSLRTNWRGLFGWYRLNQNIVQQLSEDATAFNEEAIELVDINDVFPNRDTQGEVDPTLTTLDLYFNPNRRGPYNYTKDLRSFIQNPRDVWGGFTQRLPEGYTDFNLQNIEFVEFIFKPFPENAQEDAGRDAKLYVDLGSISEDVLPNEQLNAEDGLSTTESLRGIGPWGRLPSGQQNSAIDIDGDRTEDLGLDGVVSYNTAPYPPAITETERFSDFLDALPSGGSAQLRAEVARAQIDPSGDDYQYFANDNFFNNPTIFPDGASFQERFTYWYAGHELNSFETQNQLEQDASVKRGNARNPDSEDLNFNATVDSENSYYQYEMPLSTAALDSLARPQQTDDYVVSEIERQDGSGTGWYKVRIPIRQFTRRVGNIQDFSLIESMRIWTTGHEVPITLRMATLELVGSQWRSSQQVAEDDTLTTPIDEETTLSVASINNEEDAVYESPTGAIVSQTRTTRGGQQNAREQSLVLNVENLDPGRQRGVFKTYNQGLDFLKYSNLRMFAHLHGTLGDGTRLSDLAEEEGRQKMRLFVRLGSNETSDYYEYEQPLTPTRQTAGDPELLWRPGENGMNLRLSALNQLKVARDRNASAPIDSVFWNVENGSLKPGAPDAEQFAPQGTRLAIKGTPSLQNITTVVIGIRNPADPRDGLDPANVLGNVTMWVNELRVSGYDEENGWAAVANAEVKLADLGRVQGSFQRRTDGFGALSSTLSEREQQSTLNWSMTADLNADQLLPERYGWQIPVSMQLQSNTTTPRFAPSRGDVRLSEVTDQIDARSDLSPQERDSLKSATIRAAETRSMTQSFTARIQKQGSDSWLLRNTLDGLSLNYSFARTNARNPSQRVNDSWRWSSTLSYRLTIDQPHTVKPLWFLGGVPLIGGLGDLQFNYAPQSINFSGSANRQFNQRQTRSNSIRASNQSLLPDRIANPFREQQSFSHRRNFSVQYNPFNFLNLTFDTNTNQSLNTAGADTLLNVITRDGRVFANVDTTTFFDENDIPRDSLGTTVFIEERLRMRAEDQVIGDLFRGARAPRTNNYEQRFTGTLRPSILSGETFNWIDLQDIVYRSTFRWENGALGRNTGATVRNQVDIRSGVTFHPQQFWRKFGFYRKLEEGQNSGGSDRNEDRRRRPPPDEEGEGEDDEGQSEGEENGGLSFSDLPLPNPLNVLRRVALTFTGIRDFSVTYTGGRTAQSSNVGRVPDDSTGVVTNYSLLDAFQGNGPSVGYRFGLDRRIGADQRLLSTSRLATDALSGTNQLQARTTLTPSQTFRIGLNWNVDWSSGQSITFRPTQSGSFETFRTEEGTNASSVWAFGASYLEMFKSQLETLRADIVEGQNTIGDENGDGSVVLTNESVSQDFRETYAGGLGTVDKLSLLPIPLPGWNVNYSGLSSWPLIRSVTRSVTVRHGYTADYNASYRSVTGDSLDSFRLGNRQIEFARPEFEVGTLRVNERYQPFIGVDISWLGNVQTNLSWNRSNSYTLSTTNFEVSENKTSELSLSASFRKTGLDIPLLPLGRLNNRISFNLTVSRAVNDEKRYSMRRALVAASGDPEFDPAEALQGDNVTPVTETTRLTVQPKISYQFSDRVSADFQLNYEQFNSENSRRPSFTNVSGGFFVQVNVSGQ